MFTLFLDVLQYFKAGNKVNNYFQNNINLENNNSHAASPLEILLVTPYLPYPPRTGAATRRFEMIKYLGLNNHLVVVSFTFSSKDYKFANVIDEYCDLTIIVKTRYWLSPLPSNLPKGIRLFQSFRMQNILKKFQKFNFDVIIFDSIFTAQYQKLFSQSYKILFEHNIESQIIARSLEVESKNLDTNLYLKQIQELKSFQEYENTSWRDFPLKVVVSKNDKQEIVSRCQVGETIVVKNGICTSNILPVSNTGVRKILFMGAMAYQPNIDAVHYFTNQILPLVWEQEPEVKFCIAGCNPSQSILELSHHPYIEVIPDPEDMSQIAKECIMTVVPLRIGSGTRIKILHSMAMGLPVVSTRLGSEGLNVVDGLHILLRDQPAQFAKAILQIYSDFDLRLQLRENGRLLVEKDYDWHKIFEKMETEIIMRRRRS